MTSSEYEEAYREALLCIPNNPRIGTSSIAAGERRTRINGREHSDYEVFVLGWGHSVAQQVAAEFGVTPVARQAQGSFNAYDRGNSW